MTSFKTNLFLVTIVLLAFSCNQPKNYSPSQYLTEESSKVLLRKLIPYSSKLPNGFDYKNRFDTRLDSFYTKEVENYKMEKYYISSKDSFHYFLISRPAPSLFEKRIAIGGKFKKDASENVTAFEESFWTFKMKKEEFEKKTATLFSYYVEGKDLSAFLSKNTSEEWIEFPDDKCHYNKTEQRWVVDDKLQEK